MDKEELIRDKEDIIDRCYKATHGIFDTLLTKDINGIPWGTKNFQEYIEKTLIWADEQKKPQNNSYRILDTFGYDSFNQNTVLEELLRRIANEKEIDTRPKIKFLLLDPLSPIAASRSISVRQAVKDSNSKFSKNNNTPTVLSQKGLINILDNMLKNPAISSMPEGADDDSPSKLAEKINYLGQKINVELKFYNCMTTGISYFFKDFLIKGYTPAFTSSKELLWDRIVNDPFRDNDRYDQFSEEFDKLWEIAYRKPGEPDKEAFGQVYICYSTNKDETIVKKATIIKDYLDDESRWGRDNTLISNAFLAPVTIKGGDDWKDKVQKHLNESALAIALINNTKLSNWMTLELGYFFGSGKKVIPVIVNNEIKSKSKSLPHLLRDIHSLEWLPDNQESQKKVLEEIGQLVYGKNLINDTEDGKTSEG